ncbi:MAG: cupin domain-containing protein [Holophaga sp.]|jgi:mannose-6-phosphate isomerase-like protein (cupin superfamily)
MSKHQVVPVKVGQGEQAEGEPLPWGSRTPLASRALSGSALTLDRLLVTAGRATDFHCHPDADEVCHVLRGNLSIQVGTASFLLQPGDTLAIPFDVVHRIENVGDGTAEIIQVLSSGAAETLDAAGQALRLALPPFWSMP